MTGLIGHLKELAEPIGAVQVRRMFGGYGLFGPTGMFALVTRDTLYFKVDAASAGLYEAEGLEPFSYRRAGGEAVLTSYRRAPERVFDDPDVFAEWARRAIEAAGREAGAPKRKRAGRGRPPV